MGVASVLPTVAHGYLYQVLRGNLALVVALASSFET
jgi:hypothetical protein